MREGVGHVWGWECGSVCAYVWECVCICECVCRCVSVSE